MKRLPCDNCGDAWLPGDKPYLLGHAHRFPLHIKCARCRRVTEVRASDFARLPDLTCAELDALGELEPLLCDLKGSGHSATEAGDLLACNWTPAELAALGSSPPRPPDAPRKQAEPPKPKPTPEVVSVVHPPPVVADSATTKEFKPKAVITVTPGWGIGATKPAVDLRWNGSSILLDGKPRATKPRKRRKSPRKVSPKLPPKKTGKPKEKKKA